MRTPTLAQPGLTGPPTRDVALLSVAVLAVSTSGPLIAATAVPALAIAFWRNALAGAVLTPIALLRRRDELRALTARQWQLTGLAGLLLALHFGTWVPSLGYTSVASSTALVTIQPVWSALIAHLRGQVVARRVWLGIALALGGALLLTGADLEVSGRALFGDVLALLGGVFVAGYVTVGGEVRRTVTTTSYTAVCYSTTAVLLLLACVIGRQGLSGYSGQDWLKLVALTAGAQLLGHSLFNVVLRTTRPMIVSLAVLFEIPGAALLASIFLNNQHVPVLAIPSLVLLLCGVAVVISAGGSAVAPSVPLE